jgi:hypothetical protein
MATMNDPAYALAGEFRWPALGLTLGLPSVCGHRRVGLNFCGIAYAVDPRDSDWAPLPRDCIELLDEPLVPAGWQADILMQADDKLMPGAGEAEVQALGGAPAVFDQDHFVH